MGMYNCECCNYSTEKKCNYNRHLNSKKHIKKINLCNKCPLCDYVSHRKENLKRQIPKSSGNTIINNKLSINVFLNTQCKDAMSIQDFLNQLQFSLDDLTYTKNNGYVEGISNMFVKELENLDPKERPIHCSDKKRLQ